MYVNTPLLRGHGKTHEQGSTKYYQRLTTSLFPPEATTQVYSVPGLLRAMVMAPVDVQNPGLGNYWVSVTIARLHEQCAAKRVILGLNNKFAGPYYVSRAQLLVSKYQTILKNTYKTN